MTVVSAKSKHEFIHLSLYPEVTEGDTDPHINTQGLRLFRATQKECKGLSGVYMSGLFTTECWKQQVDANVWHRILELNTRVLRSHVDMLTCQGHLVIWTAAGCSSTYTC